ncbi:MAG: response regulator, partial [Planctomycetes bacterium]|nr:response regulator [Planctomycetota bacterium]
PFADPAASPRPDIILLDLNMPRMDGYAVLRSLKADPALAAIPVTVLTTSNRDADAMECYASGANAFVPKPAEYEKFVQLFQALGLFWARFVKLPPAQP